jgi:predicted AAA+ superfamily ATPase
MRPYRERILDRLIERKLQSSGALLLRGARAVGKTTTALHHAKSSVRVDESPQMLVQAEVAPKTLLEGVSPRLIDEWQLAPGLWNAVRHEIDTRGKVGQFILTGSASPNADKTRHTGAGRIAQLALRTMTLQESGESLKAVDFASLFSSEPIAAALGGLTVEEYAGRIVRGGWPALIALSPKAASEALTDYVENLASVDLRTLASSPDPQRMKALIKSLARNIATEASLGRLAQEAQLFDGTPTAQTVRKYLDQLTQIYVLEELPAWRTHMKSSVQTRVKPKWHFVDPSLATAALRVSPQSLLDDLAAMGFFFESLAIRDLRVYAQAIDAEVFHYRDSTGLEVDAIVERYDGSWIAVEVKLGGETGIAEAVSNFKKLRSRLTSQKLEKLASCNIITAGQNSYTRPDGINLLALSHLHVDLSLLPVYPA